MSEEVDRASGGELGDETLGPPTEAQARMVYQRETYSSQFPHPMHMREYEDLYSGAAKAIFQSFEKQGDHRRQMEGLLLRGSERRANVGQFLGLGVLILVICLGFVAVIMGQAPAGCAMVGAALAGGILAYVFGHKPARAERKTKA